MTYDFEAWCSSKPIPQGRPRVARGHAFYSKRVQAYRDELTYTFRSFRDARCPLPGPVAVEIDVAGMNPRGDLDNALKGILDSLVAARVITSDNSSTVAEITVKRVEPGCGVWVRIRRLPGIPARTE